MTIFKRFLLTAVVAATASFTFADEIVWETSSEAAFKRAADEDRDVFVLITAPDWCVWCVRFEENVLVREEVKDAINDGFIPLRIYDKVNGERNPELLNFIFGGYPTVRVYKADGGLVSDAYTQDPDEFIRILTESDGKDGVTQPSPAEAYQIEGSYKGQLSREKGWMYILAVEGSAPKSFRMTSRDEEYFYLFEKESEDYLAVPYKSGTLAICNYNGGDWTPWEDIGPISSES